MPTVTVTSDTLDATLGENEIVLLDFWADWCGPCKQFAPVFESSSELNSEIVYGKIDTEDQQQLAAAAQITSIPTLMAFKKGVPVFRQSGALPPAVLEDLVTQLKELDLDAALAAAKAAEESENGSGAVDSGAVDSDTVDSDTVAE
ncbi:MAG: trxA [Microbacteriaceae bacterium]|nr:trxA [Microbacteriaceae bacterium]